MNNLRSFVLFVAPQRSWEYRHNFFWIWIRIHSHSFSSSFQTWSELLKIIPLMKVRSVLKAHNSPHLIISCDNGAVSLYMSIIIWNKFSHGINQFALDVNCDILNCSIQTKKKKGIKAEEWNWNTRNEEREREGTEKIVFYSFIIYGNHQR